MIETVDNIQALLFVLLLYTITFNLIFFIFIVMVLYRIYRILDQDVDKYLHELVRLREIHNTLKDIKDKK